MLKGASGRHYIGSTSNLEQRLEAHRRGNTATTKRLGYPLELVAFKVYDAMGEARRMERMLKIWKNPTKAVAFLTE
jgi:predicted GIY-YIG superfamily endonuclease